MVIFPLFLSLFLAHADPLSLHLDRIKLPSGFKIRVYASGVDGARSLAWGDKNILFVGTLSEGKVYAIDRKGKVFTIAHDLNYPNGVAFKDGALYVAEINRILKYENIENSLEKPPKPRVLPAKFPSDFHHGWKFIAFGPDGLLYVPIGAPCNICDKGDPYATLTRMKPDGTNFEVFARGIRNSVGFTWHPVTQELWFTDNGRDFLGDDLPPDELNRANKPGLHFGYPYCHGGDVLDPEFGKDKKCSDYVSPLQKLGPHVAALGLRFYTGKQFPSEYFQQIFIAEHGSWNRSNPIGYRITVVKLGNNGTPVKYETFAEGWLQKEGAWGRPADLINAPDGALLVSDDMNGVIYKISN